MTIRMSTHSAVMGELQPGETTRVNHEDCSAGEDTRRRLYLTRVMATPDLVIGYCHNCQQSGRHTTAKYQTYRQRKHDAGGVALVTVDTLKEPKHIDRDTANWPTVAKVWAINNNIEQRDIDTFLIGYDPTTNRIYLPRHASIQCTPSLYGSYNGYQLRLLEGTGPKYTTVVSKDDCGYSVLTWGINPFKSAILVEDMSSGIAIVKAMNTYDVAVFVNYGTKINIELVYALRRYNNTTIWLDNDSLHVKRQAEHYARTIALMGDHEVQVVKEATDPKHYKPKEIRNIIKGRWAEWTT